MDITLIQKAAAQFCSGAPAIEQLGQGLIHKTYKVHYPAGDTIILQSLNKSVFSRPEDIIYNYRRVYDYLQKQDSAMKVPAPVSTMDGQDFYTDDNGHFWRATRFMPGSFAPLLPANTDEVYAAAHCFAAFTRSLSGLPAAELKTIIPGFHDLSLRYRQLEDTIKSAHISRLLKATHVISE
ncbi:MAG: phosphotransferase, partial [Bacteroidetes bacterium]|nr:phosphotransferase [Bacteroidota bacterium]